MRHFASIAMAVAVLLSSAQATLADDNEKAALKAVRQVMAAHNKAVNQGDAKAVAALWAADGDFITAGGQHTQGRKAIQDEFARHFAQSPDLKATTKIISLRLVAPDVAILDSTVDIEPEPEGPPGEHRFTTILVKQGDQWLISSVRGAMISPPSQYANLKELEWLLGQWVVKGPRGDTIHNSIRWDLNKNFIVRDFHAKAGGRVVLSGTERIAWDPVAKRITSWTYDSDGGQYRSLWTRRGNQWIIDESGVLYDGTEEAEIHILTRVDNDTVTIEIRGRTLDGQPHPDVETREAKRIKPSK